jgi:predicted DNA-binding protein
MDLDAGKSLTQLNLEIAMARKTAVLGFSVGPALAKEYEQIAEREGRTKSDLVRRMVHSYKAEGEEQEFFSLQRQMARRMRKVEVRTEEDVERIVFEDR